MLTSNSEYLTKNLNVIRDRFPSVHKQVVQYLQEPHVAPDIQVEESAEGPVIYEKGACLDHINKPKAAANVWASRLITDPKYDDCNNIVIFGFGAGYHVESLLNTEQMNVYVVEPNMDVFVTALKIRDLSNVLLNLKDINIGTQETSVFQADDIELYMRPQTYALYPQYSAKLKAKFYGKRGFTSLHPRIGVLGPLQGGTLPMTRFVTHALSELGQLHREMDTSGYAQGYHWTKELIKDDERLKRVQGNYADFISQVILESVTEKPIDILICMAQAPITGRVLTELRKRGIITVLWFVEDYLRFTTWRESAKYYDFIFTIQKGECIELMKMAGASEVSYLPVACDPIVHTPQVLTDEEKTRWGSPISFFGAGYNNRVQTFAGMSDLPFKIWGTEWPTSRPFDKMVQEGGRRLQPAEYTKIFNATDININLHSSDEKDGIDPSGDFVNPRTMELAACGAFQLVDERSLLSELFEIGKEVITFKTPGELREKIGYYLAHPEERKEVVDAARARVLRDHTYKDRLEQMLSYIFSNRYEQLKARQENSSWNKLLKRSKHIPELHERVMKAFKRGEEPKLDGLISDIVSGTGKLSDTELKLMFLHHIRSQIIRSKAEDTGYTGV